MNIQQIRNATTIITYAGQKILIDPVLSEKGAFPPFKNTIRQELNNPIVSLPIPVEGVMDVDAVIITHLHMDHFDHAAKDMLPKDMVIFAQDQNDKETLEQYGFINVSILTDKTCFQGIELMKTPGEHGIGKTKELLGNVCGVLFSHPMEKKLYICGDTVLANCVKQVLNTYQPEVILANAGANSGIHLGKYVMDAKDVYDMHSLLPESMIVATHMEAMNHWTLSRKELREYAIEHKFSEYLLIPEDGEMCSDL